MSAQIRCPKCSAWINSDPHYRDLHKPQCGATVDAPPAGVPDPLAVDELIPLIPLIPAPADASTAAVETETVEPPQFGHPEPESVPIQHMTDAQIVVAVRRATEYGLKIQGDSIFIPAPLLDRFCYDGDALQLVFV